MSLVGFKGTNHPQQVRKRGAVDCVDDRGTTADLFAPLHAEFAFTVDVAAAAHNAKVPRFFDRETNGLAQPWAGERVWCNPPYSDIGAWVRKAWAEPAALVVMLLPANRTEQGWWQDHVEPFRDRPGSRLSTRYLRDRRRFIRPGQTKVGPNERPPYGLVVLVFAAVHHESCDLDVDCTCP